MASALSLRRVGIVGRIYSQSLRQCFATKDPPPDLSRGGTADLCDVYHPEAVDVIHEPLLKIAQPIFKSPILHPLHPDDASERCCRDFGGNAKCSGVISTVKCYENNPLVRRALEEEGKGRVLVVDGGASMRCALLGDNLAEMAYKNGWSGIIVHGCIRDAEEIKQMPLLVKALATHPLKSSKRDAGLRDVPVQFAGVSFIPGHWLAADVDGIVLSEKPLS